MGTMDRTQLAQAGPSKYQHSLFCVAQLPVKKNISEVYDQPLMRTAHLQCFLEAVGCWFLTVAQDLSQQTSSPCCKRCFCLFPSWLGLYQLLSWCQEGPNRNKLKPNCKVPHSIMQAPTLKHLPQENSVTRVRKQNCCR